MQYCTTDNLKATETSKKPQGRREDTTVGYIFFEYGAFDIKSYKQVPEKQKCC